ncbi:MAG: hypothetical protein IT437_07135 [Phycisphaerales bacterium]|nr:hypothetical protein [Phycisphaerales bacterium]
MTELTRIISENFFWFMGGLIALTAIVSGAISKTVRSTSRERTRREIAAYIAEGSMTPEQGERLMAAGKKPESCC